MASRIHAVVVPVLAVLAIATTTSGTASAAPHAAASITVARQCAGHGHPSAACHRPLSKSSSQPASISPAAITGSYYKPLTPARIADTRSGSGQPYAGQTLGAGATLSVQVAGRGGVATNGATAAVLNLTATGGTSGTVVTAYPAGSSLPASSTMNPPAGVTVNNETTVKLGSGGQVSIHNSAGQIDIIIDVEGYFASSGSGFVPIPTTRIADTRAGSGLQGAGNALPAGGTLNVQVTKYAGVPVGASGAAIQLTAVAPSHGGYLTVYPAGQTLPPVSTLSFQAASTITKSVTVALGSSPKGAIKVYTSAGTTNVIVDVVGYFTSGRADTYTPVNAARIADTRTGSGQRLRRPPHRRRN